MLGRRPFRAIVVRAQGSRLWKKNKICAPPLLQQHHRLLSTGCFAPTTVVTMDHATFSPTRHTVLQVRDLRASTQRIRQELANELSILRHKLQEYQDKNTKRISKLDTAQIQLVDCTNHHTIEALETLNGMFWHGGPGSLWDDVPVSTQDAQYDRSRDRSRQLWDELRRRQRPEARASLEENVESLKHSCQYMSQVLKREEIDNWWGLGHAVESIQDGKYDDAASSLLSMYGGMGSFNDVWVRDDEFNNHRNEAYTVAIEIRIKVRLQEQEDTAANIP